MGRLYVKVEEENISTEMNSIYCQTFLDENDLNIRFDRHTISASNKITSQEISALNDALIKISLNKDIDKTTLPELRIDIQNNYDKFSKDAISSIDELRNKGIDVKVFKKGNQINI